MELSKNKKHHYLFFFILSVYTIFNGGNSNLLIQINFILISLFFLTCLKDKNYNLHFENFYKNNKVSLIFYFIFLLYLVFQILPLPIDILKKFSPEKYYYLNNLSSDSSYSSISLSPINSFFQLLNFISLLILVFILKMIFYTERHKNRMYLFLTLSGFFCYLVALIFYLYCNIDFLFLKNDYYKSASTGFFINRTVFAIFLLFSLISSLELLKNLDLNVEKKKDNFFLKIYVRLFIIFITIGIITSYSRIGNFLLLVTVLFYFINEFFVKKNNNKVFKSTILLIIFFDVLALGVYFGSSQILERFYFLKEEFSLLSLEDISLNRLQIIRFGLNQINNFLFFGYGSGAFETLFKINFHELGIQYANHAHSDIIEFFGEFGLIGFTLITFSLINFVINKKFYSFINLIILIYLIVLLAFDFSLHVPFIQVLFIIFLSLNKKNSLR